MTEDLLYLHAPHQRVAVEVVYVGTPQLTLQSVVMVLSTHKVQEVYILMKNEANREFKPCRSNEVCNCDKNGNKEYPKCYASDSIEGGIKEYLSTLAVTSGYRSEALNEAINGSKTSQHSKGEALDLDADVFGGFSNAELFNYIKDHLDFDQLIWEFGNNNNPDWVHCSYKTRGNRNEVLIAIKTNGKTTYRKL